MRVSTRTKRRKRRSIAFPLILAGLLLTTATLVSFTAPNKEDEPIYPSETLKPLMASTNVSEERTKALPEPKPVETEAETEPEPVETSPLDNAIFVGECRITHYCCEKYAHTCGTGQGITATGTNVKPGIVAVDPKVIPLHSDVYIDGQWYKAEDTGGAIKGNRVDIAVETHQGALQLGVKYAEVYYIPPTE